ncbi:beethoven [Carabus blaptoides fortunei]
MQHLMDLIASNVISCITRHLSNIDIWTEDYILLLYEFKRYAELMERPAVKKILLAERQSLLTYLGEYTKHLSGMSVSEENFTKSDTPKIVLEIANMRQLESKAIMIQQTLEKLLNDLAGYDELHFAITELMNDLKHQHSELFDSWTRELSTQINNKKLSLRETEPVVRFSAGQLMLVNYSSRLVSLVREYRQLAAMGYRIPSHIEQTALHAKQFMKYAKALEQVANFHNTIGDRMIESQRPMMLAGALELSKLVQQEEVVSWGDVKSVEKYVENLRAAVNRLSRENNLLASYHAQILQKIAELDDMDLIRHLQKWKDTAKQMRDIMHQVTQQSFTNTQTWKLEIDKRLSSVFEQQYRFSLDTAHLHLPEIYSDIIYRDSRLQFNPSEEKLREKYQYQLKRFLDLPKSFRGVSDNTEGSAFAEIVDRCKDLYVQTEKRTEELFIKLGSVLEHWQSWLSLGKLDTSQLSTWQHWDLNFRASKTFGQEIAKFPSTEERVGCFVISLSCLRTDLESHNRSYWSHLISSLQDSIAQDVVRLQQYVNTSTSILTKQPVTMEQIGQAHISHSDILKQMPEMTLLFEEMENKNKTLASWSRERVDSVANLQAAWERLQSLIDNHQHLISKQVEAFKSTMNRTCEGLNSEIERFSVHWDQFKPRPGSGQIATDSLKKLEQYLATLKEKRTQWNELLKQKEKIM